MVKMIIPTCGQTQKLDKFIALKTSISNHSSLYPNRYNRETGEGQLETPPEVKIPQQLSDNNLRNMKGRKPSQTEGMKMKVVRT